MFTEAPTWVATGEARLSVQPPEIWTKQRAGNTRLVGDMFDRYAVNGAWDEMFSSARIARPSYDTLHDVLGTLSSDDFRARCALRDRSFRDQGITFSLSGEERPFPL